MIAADLRDPYFDPVFDGQALFRCALEATARPGVLVSLPVPPLALSTPHLRPACALLLGLLDVETTLHVLGDEAAAVADYCAANTGARLAPLDQANFVLVVGPSSAGRIARVKRGSLTAPHEGATLVYAPDALSAGGGPGVALRLAGPGVPTTRVLSILGIAAPEIEAWRSLVDFPMGVDLWLAAANGQMAAIPRSTRWERVH